MAAPLPPNTRPVNANGQTLTPSLAITPTPAQDPATIAPPRPQFVGPTTPKAPPSTRAGDLDYGAFTTPSLARSFAPQARAQQSAEDAAQREQERQQNEIQKANEAAARANAERAKRDANNAAEATFRQTNRPHYTDADGIIRPIQDDQTWAAEQQAKQENAQQQVAWKKAERPTWKNPVTNQIEPIDDEETWAAKQATAAAKRTEDLRRKVIDDEIAKAQIHGADPARATLNATARTKIEKALKDEQEAAKADLITRHSTTAKAVTGGNDFIPFNEAPAPEAQTAKARLEALNSNFDGDLSEEDLADLEADPTTAPRAAKLRALQTRLAQDDENTAFQQTNAEREFDLKLKRTDPAAWAARRQQRLDGLAPADHAKALEAEAGDFTARLQQHEQEAAPLIAQQQQHATQLADLETQAAAARQKGIPAGDLITLTGPDGPQDWPKSLAETYLRAQQQAETWQADNRDSLDLLQTRQNELQVEQEALVASEAQAQEKAKAQRAADLDRLTQSPITRPLGEGMAALEAEAEQRRAAITAKFPDPQSPQAQEALKALETDLQTKNAALQEDTTFRQTTAQQAYAGVKERMAADPENPNIGQHFVEARQNLVDLLGVTPKEADTILDDQMKGDWSLTNVPDRSLEKYLQDGGKLKEPVRILSSGDVVLNPELLANEQSSRAAIAAAPTSAAAKARALEILPTLRAKWAEAMLPAFTDKSTPFFLDFNEWREAKVEKGGAFNRLKPSEQLMQYLDEREADHPAAKLGRHIGTGLYAGFMDIATQGLSIAAMGANYIPTGLGPALSEELSSLATANQANSQAVSQTAAFDQAGLITRGLGQAARIAPSLVPSLAGGAVAQGALIAATRTAAGRSAVAGILAATSKAKDAKTAFTALQTTTGLVGAGAAGAAQTAGAQYADIYGELRGQGMTHKEAHAAAITPALLSGAATAILTVAFGATGAEKLLEAGAKQAVKNRFTNFLKEAGKGFFAEQPEEILDEMFSTVVSDLAKNPNKPVTQSITEFIETIPELAIAIGLMGGAGAGIAALRAPAAPKTSPEAAAQAPDPTKLPEVLAAARAAITGYQPAAGSLLTPQAATAALEVAQGNFAKLTTSQLESLGWTRENGKLKPLKGYAGPPALEFTDKEQTIPILRQELLDEIDAALPEVGDAIALDEAEARQLFQQQQQNAAAPAEAPAPGLATNVSGAAAPAEAPTAEPPPSPVPVSNDTFNPAEAERTEQITNHLTALGLDQDAAEKVAAHMVRVQGVMGEDYRFNVVADSFKAELKKLGITGALTRVGAQTNPLKAPPDLDARLSPVAPAGAVAPPANAPAVEAPAEPRGDSAQGAAAPAESGEDTPQETGPATPAVPVSAPSSRHSPNSRAGKLAAMLVADGSYTQQEADDALDDYMAARPRGTEKMTVIEEKKPLLKFLADRENRQNGGKLKRAQATATNPSSAEQGSPTEEGMEKAQARAVAAQPAGSRRRARRAMIAMNQALKKWGKAFDRIDISAAAKQRLDGGAMAVDTAADGATVLLVDLDEFATQHSWSATSRLLSADTLSEEIIHALAKNLAKNDKSFSDTALAKLWDDLTPKIRQTVWDSYNARALSDDPEFPRNPPAGAPVRDKAALTHEFLRMLVQKKAFTKRVTEEYGIDPRGILDRIAALLKKLSSALQEAIGESSKDLQTRLEAYQTKLLSAAEQLEGSPNSDKNAAQGSPNSTNSASKGAVTSEDNRAPVIIAGSPAPTAAGPNSLTTGAKGTAYTDTNDAIEYEWAVVETAELTISNRDDGTVDPAYPQELQPRDRTSAGSEAQVQDIAKNANLDRLSATNTVGDGAPIIGPDGVVESGNGRTMGIRRAYMRGLDSAARYKQRLQDTAGSYGLTSEAVAKMKAPMLVRVRTTNVDRVAFVMAANVSTIAPKREIEQAKTDAKQIVPELFESFVASEDGDIFTAANAEFIRGFIAGVVPPAERPAIYDAKGFLSQTGLRRIRNALFVFAYGDSKSTLNALARLTEDIEANGRNLVNALVALAPRFGEQNARIAAGALRPLSITADLAEALAAYQGIKERGETVENWTAQATLPGVDDGPTDIQKAIVATLHEHRRSGRKLMAVLNRYAAGIETLGDPKQASLFGDEPTPTTLELWDIASQAEPTPLAMARKVATKTAYERRIDALFAGSPGQRQGIKILDRADILDLLGHGNKALHLIEGAVGKKENGQAKHPGMTAAMWKKVPEWIENPVAAFRSQTTPDRLVLFAPELVNERPVRLILSPNGNLAGLNVHVLVNAYEEGGTQVTPVEKWVANGDLVYLDQQKNLKFSKRSGLRLPRDVRQIQGTQSILTEADLVNYRQSTPLAMAPKTAGIAPNNALKLYRKLKQIEKERGALDATQAQTLRRAEAALGQTFFPFEAEAGAATADFSLETESTSAGGNQPQAEQLRLFTTQRVSFKEAVNLKKQTAARMEAELTPAFRAAVETSLQSGKPPVYPGLAKAMPSPNLDRESRIVEARFFQQIAENPGKAMAAYLKLAKEDFGNTRYLNADLARSVFPEYAQHSWFRTVFDSATIAPAGYLTLGLLYPRFLTQRKNARLNKVVMLAGGPSSGKTTVANDLLKPALDEAVAIVDSVMGSIGGSRYLINTALDAGIRPNICFVYRPFELAAIHALKRLVKTGRPVNVESTANLHYNAQRTFTELTAIYADTVDFTVLANDGYLSDIRTESLEFLVERAYYNSDDSPEKLARSYGRIVENEYDQGGLSSSEYAAARWGRVDERDSGEIESRPRSGRSPDRQEAASPESLVNPPRLAMARKTSAAAGADLFSFDFSGSQSAATTTTRPAPDLGFTSLLTPAQQQTKLTQADQLDLFGGTPNARPRPTSQRPPQSPRPPRTQGAPETAPSPDDLFGQAGMAPPSGGPGRPMGGGNQPGQPGGERPGGNNADGGTEAGGPGTDTAADGNSESRPDSDVPRVPPPPSNTDPEPISRPSVGDPARNFDIPDDLESLAPATDRAKILANMEAIRLLKELEAEQRNATPEEKRALASYTGWGAFKEAFNTKYEQDLEYWDGKPEYQRQNMPEWLQSWERNHRANHRLLRQAMTEEEFASASASTLNAHYTALPIIRGMWKMLERLGFKGGRALEPSAGAGHYIGAMPAGLANTTQWQTVELDELSARLLAKLYPEATVNEERADTVGNRDVTGLGFERARIPNGSLDIVISNVPFHESGPSKKGFPSLNLHNFFFAHALDKVKPGGLIAFITSESTMQNNIRQRDFIASKGDLVAAFRLPNNAFKANAGTEVTTDIIIIRKPDGTPFKGEPWRNLIEVGRQNITLTQGKDQTADEFRREAERMGDVIGKEFWKGDKRALTVSAPIMVNEYFVNHPQHALGEHTLASTMYRAGGYALVAPDGFDVTQALAALIPTLPANIMGEQTNEPTKDVVLADRSDKPFSFKEQDGKIYEVQPDGSMDEAEWWTNPDTKEDQVYDEGQAERITQRNLAEWGTKNADLKKQGKRPSQKPKSEAEKYAAKVKAWRSWRRVADAIQELVEAETSNSQSPEAIEKLRRTLNLVYNTHVTAHNFISRRHANQHKHLYSDPAYPLTAALESEIITVDRKTGKKTFTYRKADIFTKRIGRPIVEPTSADTIDAAIETSLAWRGRIDVPYAASLLNISTQQLRREALQRPNIFLNPTTGMLETSEDYLAGNVRVKLEQAKTAAQDDPQLQRNVEALQKAQPERREISRISPTLGGRWIPAEVYQSFISEVLQGTDTVEYIPAGNTWIISGSALYRTEEFGTERKSAAALFKHALNMTEPLVYDGSGDDRTFNPAATAAAKVALDKMRRAFIEFSKTSETKVTVEGTRLPVWEAVENAFNESQNSYVTPSHSGAYLTFPGLNTDYVYTRSHRRGVIARFLSTRRGMMAHGVGSGKTFNQIILSQELRRLGLAKKPMIVVQNATLGQFAKSYLKAYPGAKVLVPTKTDFQAKNRRKLVAKIATGDWDAVLLPHSQFDLISNRPEAVKAYMDGQIEEMMSIVNKTKDKAKVRDLEGMIKRLRDKRQKMLDALAERQDTAVMWEELGIDALIMDEAHNYKSLPIVTRMGRVKGVPSSSDSQRAINFMLKCRDVQAKTGGKNIFLATGTPIKNSMAEAYIMMQFMAPDVLEDFKIYNFDDFATTYGQTVTEAEMAWGGTPKMETRFAKFQNGASLVTLIRTMFDVAYGNEAMGLDVPKVKGGEPEMVIVPATPIVDQFNAWTRSVNDAWINADSDVKEEFTAVPIQTMAAGIAAALDPRLISPGVEDHPGSKVNEAVRRVLDIFKAGTDKRTTQIIFSDLRNKFSMDYLEPFTGLPFDEGTEGEFDLYKDLQQKLIAGGVPANEVHLMQSGMTDVQKAALFEKVDNGEIRIIIGSTELLGVGVNIQTRLNAVHHLMPPRDFTPAMMEQRNGRIIRQGNLHFYWAADAFAKVAERITGKSFRAPNGDVMIKEAEAALQAYPEALEEAKTAAAEFEIEIICYGTEGSMDSAIYGTLARKQRFITQLLMGEDMGDTFDDPTDPVAVNMAEMAARTLGDPDFIRRIELEKEIRDLRLQAEAFTTELSGKRSRLARLESEIRYGPEYVKSLNDQAARLANLFTRTAPRPEGIKEDTDITDKPVYEFGGQTVDTASKDGAIVNKLDLFLLDTSKATERRGKASTVVTLTINGTPIKVRVDITIPGQPTSGAVLDLEENVMASFNGAASLIQQIRRQPGDIEAQIRMYYQRFAEVEVTAERLRAQLAQLSTFPEADRLAELELEAREVDERIRIKASPRPPTTPGAADNQAFSILLEAYRSSLDSYYPSAAGYYPTRLAMAAKTSSQAELAGIEARAKAAGTWMKAPNGQPTRLTEDQWKKVRTQTFKEAFGDWEALAHETAFTSAIDSILAGTYDMTRPVQIGNTPEVLLAAGAEPLLITMPPSMVSKVTKEAHDLPAAIVRELSTAIKDPIFVFESATRPDALTVILDLKHQGQNVLVAVHLNKREGRHEVNRIASIYDKSNPRGIESWIKSGLLRYTHQQKSRDWFRSRGLQLPKEGTPRGNSKLRTDADVVNRVVTPSTITQNLDENGEPLALNLESPPSPLAMAPKVSDTLRNENPLRLAQRPATASQITGGRLTVDQGQAVSAGWKTRLQTGLREGELNFGSRTLAQSLAAAFPGVPILTSQEEAAIRALPVNTDGAEAKVYIDRAGGLVYKRLADGNDEPSAGIWPILYTSVDGSGKLDWTFDEASRARHLGIRLGVMTAIGGTPTEIHGFSSEGHIYLKQPLSPNPNIGTDRASFDNDALAVARRRSGIVEIPANLLPRYSPRAYLVTVGGRPWFLTDLQPSNFIGDNQGEARVNDPVVGHITPDLLGKVPGLGAIVKQAIAEEQRLGDRSARLFMASKTSQETLANRALESIVSHDSTAGAGSGRNPPMEVVSALSNLRASAGANSGQSQRQNRFGEKARQTAILNSVANNRVLPGRFVADEGEHRVYHDGNTAHKATNNDQFGYVLDQDETAAHLKLALRPALPFEYLERLGLQNVLFGDEIKVTGIQKGYIPSIQSIQPWVTGETPDMPSITDWMEDRGWRHLPPAMITPGVPKVLAWYHHGNGVLAFDTKPSNFVTVGERIVAIDLSLTLYPEELLEETARTNGVDWQAWLNEAPASTPLFTAQRTPNPLAALGWNHLDKSLSSKLAAHTRWMNEKTGAGETVAAWMQSEKVKPFTALGNVLKRELFPDSVLPREITARLREMNIKSSMGAQRAMDLTRALSGTPKFSDIVYPPGFAENPLHRRHLYEAMAGMRDMATLAPELQTLAKRLRSMLVEIGQEAVKQGRMSLDTFEGLRENYMPHFYEEDVAREKSFLKRFALGIKDIFAQRTTAWHIVDTQTKDKTGEPRLVSHDGNKWRFKNKEHRDAWFEDFIAKESLDRLQSRDKRWRSLTLADLNKRSALPAEARGRLQEIENGLRARYRKEKPLSLSEQEKAGLILDPVYSLARYAAQMVHDNATAEFFNFVASKPEWISDTPTPGFTQLPENTAFGRLSGKHVEDDIYRQLTELVETPNTALRLYDTVLSWWKAGKTVYNPSTHARNLMGNIPFATFAGTNPLNPGNLRYYRDAIRHLRNGGATLTEAYEDGVLGADFVSAELRQTLRQLLPDPATIDESERGESILLGIGKAIGQVIPHWAKNPLHKLNNQVTALYQAEDEVYKLAAYIKAREMGMNRENAAAHVRKWFPYYDVATSATLKGLQRTAMPFLSFYRESIRIFGHAVTERPIALAATLALPSIVTFLSAMALGLDDDELEQIRKDMRGKGGKLLGPTPLAGVPIFSMLLPFKSGTGTYQQFDISAVHPFADHLGNRVETDKTEDGWQRTWRSMLTAGPIGNLIYAQVTGRDAFGDRPFVEDNMTPGEKLAARLDNAAKTALPPLTPFVGTNFETIANSGEVAPNKSLEFRSPGQAVARAVFGMDVRNATPDIYRIAEDWRKTNNIPTTEGMDFSATTPQSRARKELFAQLAQPEPNLAAIKNLSLFLEKQGSPVRTADDVRKLLFYRNPLMVIRGKENQQRFRASLTGQERTVLESAIQDFEAISRRAPSLILQSRAQ